MRLDRWLKTARLYKTRSWAKRACEDGRVKIGRKRAKPSSLIAIGDTISITRKGKVMFYEVKGLSERSLPPGKAAGLYREKERVVRKGSEIMRLIEEAEEKIAVSGRKGKPTKKDRRMIRKVRGY